MHEILFIVGCGRSGTTLLRSMLVGHPCIQIPGETHYVPIILRFNRLLDLMLRGNPDYMAKILCSNKRLKLSGIDYPELRNWLRAHEVKTIVGAMVSVYELYAALNPSETSNQCNRFILGDKTPSYIRHIPLISTNFKHCRFIHVIRDGRETAASLVGMPWGPKTLHGALSHWERQVRLGRKSSTSKILADRYIEVRYEDIVLEPRETLSEICKFLGVSFVPDMIKAKNKSEIAEQNFFPDSHSRIGHKLELSTHKHKAIPTESQRSLLQELGYEVESSSSLSASESLLAWLDDRFATFPLSKERVRTIVKLLASLVRR